MGCRRATCVAPSWCSSVRESQLPARSTRRSAAAASTASRSTLRRTAPRSGSTAPPCGRCSRCCWRLRRGPRGCTTRRRARRRRRRGVSPGAGQGSLAPRRPFPQPPPPLSPSPLPHSSARPHLYGVDTVAYVPPPPALARRRRRLAPLWRRASTPT